MMKESRQAWSDRSADKNWEHGASEWEGRMAGQSEPATEIAPGALQ
jgi:hypothetical protein